MNALARASVSRGRIATAPGPILAISDGKIGPRARHVRFGMLLLLAGAGLLAPTPAQAWSAFGHRLIALLAQEQLSESTRTQVDALLALEPGADMGTIAAWADEVRDLPRYENTGPSHYVNIKDARCQYVAMRDCPGGACIVAALPHYLQILGEHSTRAKTVRLEALKFVVHLVGDVHQPLHAGNRDDRGGNQFQINLNGEATNLHAVWDYHVLHSADLDLPAYRQRLRPRVRKAVEASPWLALPKAVRELLEPGVRTMFEALIRPMQVRLWAQTSCALIDRQTLYPSDQGTLPDGYLEQQRPIAEQQIVLAAARLAAVLEQALGTTGRTDLQR